MHPFTYSQPTSLHEALTAVAPGRAAVVAGGTELLNWMRIGIVRPAEVVDLSRVPGLDQIQVTSDRVTIGALATLNEVAAHPAIATRYPVLREALLKSASPQIRNLATIGGNPLQFTRCPYFRAERLVACNKRVPGSGCAALDGNNERHAIFGWTKDCVAVHPSDPATALAALDADLLIAHADGTRRLPIRELHVLPSDDPAQHHVLRDGEVVTSIEITGAAPTSAYVKVRERESYEYATVSAAVTLAMEGPVINSARIAVGSVALSPWRLPAAEAELRGTRLGSVAVTSALHTAFADARPLTRNAHKVALARNAVLRAIETAAGRA